MENAGNKSKHFLAGLLIGALIVGGIFAVWQRHLGRENFTDFTLTQAKQLCCVIEPSLSFNDKRDANRILHTLFYLPSVVYAGVYNKNGKLFAEYYGPNLSPGSVKPADIPEKAGLYFEDGYLKAVEPVIREDEYLGKVCIWTERQSRF